MSKYTYNDIVMVKKNAPSALRPGSKAWVVAVFEFKRPGKAQAHFPEGTIYSIEFESGDCIDIHENDLEKIGSKGQGSKGSKSQTP